MYLFALAAAAVALFFLVVGARDRRGAAIAAGVLWAAYSLYEYYVANGTLCDANCNIRVDLLIAWPLLAIATLFAVYTPEKRPAIVKILGAVALAVLVLVVAPFAYFALVGVPAATQSDRSTQPRPP